ncbi:MAG: hypothetical protein ACM3UZ_13835 [Acidobacteriota bacterium]
MAMFRSKTKLVMLAVLIAIFVMALAPAVMAGADTSPTIILRPGIVMGPDSLPTNWGSIFQGADGSPTRP